MKRNRRAFTIVELVIVIAVIAVLAGVMIPTFSGVIKSANKSADESELVALNTLLATNEIATEEDLYALIEETYGADKADVFAPRSAKYGLHYWYDVEHNKVVLGTYEQAMNGTLSLAAVMPVDIPEIEMHSLAIPASAAGSDGHAKNAKFKENCQDSFKLFNGYYILDKGGSVVGDALKVLTDGGEDFGDRITALNNIKASEPAAVKAMAQGLKTNLESTAIVSDDMTFVYNADKVGKVYFVPGTVTVSNNIVSLTEDGVMCNVDYIANGTTEITVNVPATVTKILENSLVFEGDSTNVTIKVNFKIDETTKDIFEADATNAVIVDTAEEEFEIDADKIASETTEYTLDYGNKVESFTLSPVGLDENDYVYIGNTLYIPHNVGTVKLEPTDFVATVNSETVNKGMKDWTATEGFSVSADGEVTINVPELFDQDGIYEGTITAKSVTSDASAELTICVNVMRLAEVKIGEKLILIDNTTYGNAFTLTYSGTTETAEYAISEYACTYLYPEFAECCKDVEPEFSTSGNLFTIEDGKLKLNLGADNLNGEQALTVRVGNHLEKTFTVTVVDNSAAEFSKNFTGPFLYRVGNSNAITLGSLFTADSNVKECTVTIYNSAKTTLNGRVVIATSGDGVFKAVYTENSDWSKSTIKFDGTGVAIIEIRDGNGTPVEVAVEVVNGKNVTSESEWTTSDNVVLLNSIDWTKNSTTSMSGKTIYGNGFAINATTHTNANKGNNALFTLNNCTVDNLVINGPVYPELIYMNSASASKPYYVSGLYLTGDCVVSNSYISGFREPIKANGTFLYLENTTLVGGNYANLSLQTGSLSLKDVTTVQKPTASTVGSSATVLGAGIVVESGISDICEITIEGYLKQYNWVTESDKKYIAADVSTLVGKMFENTALYHTVDGTKYINTGILFSSTRTKTINDNRSESEKVSATYGSVNVSGSFMGMSASATVYTHVPTNGFVSSIPEYEGYVSNKQLTLKPDFKHNLTLENGAVNIVIDVVNNETYVLDVSKYTVSKYTGQPIVVNVSCDGGTVSDDDKITFSKAGTYTITYEVVDNTFYNLDGAGADKAVTYVYTVKVVVKNSNHPNAVINVGSHENKSKWVTTGTSLDKDYQAWFEVLNGITITDYNEDGSSFTVTPTASDLKGLTIKSNHDQFTGTSVDGNDYWIYDTKDDNGNTTAYSITFTYTYTGKNGATVTATITSTLAAGDDEDGKGSCVTPDTLVTLADGTQKEIQYVTYEDQLLVWNHFVGKYEVVPAAIIFNHGYGNNTVIKLNFSDGTQVKAINLHQFLNADLKQYVSIDANTVAQYVGDSFVKQSGDGYTTVVLESYEISEEYIEAYGIISALHYNILVEGMFSTDFMLPDYDLFNYFTIGEGMIYDAEQMQKDIEQYGLYTYADFAEYLTYEQFVGFNVQYFKIAVGKGLYTYEGILNLIETYLNA